MSLTVRKYANFHMDFPLLEELCIRRIDASREDIFDDAAQLRLLSQLPEELKAKIFSYFEGTVY